MHNAYGPVDDVDILIRATAPTTDEDATPVTIGGYDGLYRQFAGGKEWILKIEGTTVSILVRMTPDVSEESVADVHAIVNSIRIQPEDNELGFSLVFTLTNDYWDSG